MKAVIKDIVKHEEPRLDMVSGTSVPTLVVAVTVDYVHDNGDPHSSATHTFLPDELDDVQATFDRQAEVMQREIDETKARAHAARELAAKHEPVDNKVAELRRRFLNVSDQVPLGDKGDNNAGSV